MKKTFLILGILVVSLMIGSPFLKASDDPGPFLGSWALILPNNVPGWIEVRQEDGYLVCDMLWGSGSVFPLDNIYIDGENLILTRSRGRQCACDELNQLYCAHLKTKYEIQNG